MGSLLLLGAGKPPVAAAGVAAIIEGTGQVGTYMWANGVAPFQWKRAGVDISGATSQSYLVDAADDNTALTCVDSSAIASNSISASWVYQSYTGPFTLDMDVQNGRFWFDGVRYNQTDFEALSWVPVLSGSLINKLFTTSTLPYPGFSNVAVTAIGYEATTDSATDTSLFDFSNNSANEWAAVQLRWATAGNFPRLVVVDNGATQVTSVGPNAMITGTAYMFAGKFKLNDFWMVDQFGVLVKDQAGTMPAMTQMRTGAVASGTNIAAGAIHRVAVEDSDVPLLEVQHAMLKTRMIIAYDSEVSLNDGVDARDIFADGFPAIVNSNQNGKVFLYRQQTRGKFTRTAIRSTTITSAKVEGVCLIDSRGDGVYQAAVCDQDVNIIRLYEPTIPGDYAQVDWAVTTILSSKNRLQDVKAIVASGDDRETLFYTYEGTTGGTGGIGKLRWNGSSFTDTLLDQQSGAWGIGGNTFANGDLVYSARNSITGGNPGASAGIFRITQAGTQTVINADAHDWLRVCVGDFFGNGNEDVCACHYDGTTEIFSLFNSASSWAETVINHETETNPNLDRNYGVHNLGYKANSRDAILAFGEGKASVWHWSGSAWAVVQRWDDMPITFKADDTIARMRITRRAKEDIVVADSLGNTLTVFALN